MVLTLTNRDRVILRAEVADKIESLLPLTRMGLPWRATFERQARYWRSVANGRPECSEERRDANGWALAHEFVLAEVLS